MSTVSIVGRPNDRKTEIIHLDTITQFGFPPGNTALMFRIQGLQNILVM